MKVFLSKPLQLDPLALLAAEEARLTDRLAELRARKAEMEEQRKKEPQASEPKVVECLDLDVEALTGKDIAFCTREAEAATGLATRVIVTDQDIHVQIVAKASGLSVAQVTGLPARDYVEVITAVQSFLTGSSA